MKNLLFILFILATCSLPAQNIVLAGPIDNADTTFITVWSKGKVILETIEVEPVYTLRLGGEQEYTIDFVCKGQTKVTTLITYGMKREIIHNSVDFGNLTHVIIYLDKQGLLKRKRKHRSSDPLTYLYYGFHAYRKKF